MVNERFEEWAIIPAYTKFVGTGVVYSITPCSEEFAKVAARRIRALPHNMYIPELFMPEEDIQIEHDRDETANEKFLLSSSLALSASRSSTKTGKGN